MILPSLTDTEVEVDRGHAMVEVAEIHPENSIRVDDAGTTTQLLKTGLYDFNQNQRDARLRRQSIRRERPRTCRC